MKPILRWAGSKRQILPKLLQLAPNEYARYVEPFCGSACLFLQLAPEASILSDRNPHLVSMYVAVRDRPLNVAKYLHQWLPTKDNYLHLRSEPLSTGRADYDAAKFLFLNRLCFNGVYRENKSGQFNVPFSGVGTGKIPTAEYLVEFSEKIKQAKFICSDFEGVLNKTSDGDFVYLDPPYYYDKADKRGGEYGYGAFSDTDIGRFSDSVRSASDRGAKILISYNKAQYLKNNFFKDWALSYCYVRRSVAGFAEGRQVVREFQIRNY